MEEMKQYLSQKLHQYESLIQAKEQELTTLKSLIKVCKKSLESLDQIEKDVNTNDNQN